MGHSLKNNELIPLPEIALGVNINFIYFT